MLMIKHILDGDKVKFDLFCPNGVDPRQGSNFSTSVCNVCRQKQPSLMLINALNVISSLLIDDDLATYAFSSMIYVFSLMIAALHWGTNIYTTQQMTQAFHYSL
jgi:hypothetical protein